jgi:glycosyltransferase involved in cell wall biosynthesis
MTSSVRRQVKRVLMIAFHFPPQRGSSGIQRTLKFVRHLPDLGWEPLVLSAHPRAYENTGADQLGEIPATVPVRRAFALDSARHLALRGRYPGLLALPDRWASWVLGAVPAGLALVRRMRPRVIWSTYPIASAHLAALALHRLTGLPWVADLRDPMIDDSHPNGRLRRRVATWIEAHAVRHAARVVVTTSGALRSYRARYPEAPPERFRLIENGYDEDAFAGLAPAAAQSTASADRPFTLLHSGVVYPSERDPIPLFRALAALRARGAIAAGHFRLLLRAPAHETLLRPLIAQYGLADMIEIGAHLPYRAALQEMLAADGLLVLQAANCNDQVPAKLYEYLRAGRPILALTDPSGDTASLLRQCGIDTIAPLDASDAIADALARFIDLARAGQTPHAAHEQVRAAERRQRTAQLAALLDEVTNLSTEHPCM